MEVGTKHDKLTIRLYRLFNEISLLEKQGTRAQSDVSLLFYGCGSLASGMVIYISADD